MKTLNLIMMKSLKMTINTFLFKLSNNFESTESFYDHDGAVVVWLEFYLPNGLLNMRTWASVPPVLGPIAFEVGSIPDLLWMCDLGL